MYVKDIIDVVSATKIPLLLHPLRYAPEVPEVSRNIRFTGVSIAELPAHDNSIFIFFYVPVVAAIIQTVLGIPDTYAFERSP